MKKLYETFSLTQFLTIFIVKMLNIIIFIDKIGNVPNLLFDMAQNQILTYSKGQRSRTNDNTLKSQNLVSIMIFSFGIYSCYAKLRQNKQVRHLYADICMTAHYIPHLNEGWGILVWIWITLISALACLVACMMFH